MRRDEWVREAEEDEREEIPERPVGVEYVDSGGRKWRRVRVAFGASGGRWGYWAGKSGEEVIADRIFNEGAGHFAGMLRVAHDGERGTLNWLMTERGPYA